MDKHNPKVSIIIPTHNRSSTLNRTLDVLQRQTYPLDKIEIIVVADGCTDGTAKMVGELKPLFDLYLVEQPSQGAAVARNNGALKSNGSILIFLDDDIESSPGLVENHVLIHQEGVSKVVIGNLPPILQNQKGFFLANLREWWEDMFYEMSLKGHRFGYRNLLSGNFSLTARLFNSIGGFDPNFKCQEDYELGIRLIKAGVMFSFAPKALGFHHEKTELKRSFVRKFEEGKSSVLFAKKYPNILPTLPILCNFTEYIPRRYRYILFFCYAFPNQIDKIARVFETVLVVLEKFRMRRTWQMIVYKLFAYWYLRGVVGNTENYIDLKYLLQKAKNCKSNCEPMIEVDIKAGLSLAEYLMDTKRPSSLIVKYGSETLGTIPEKFGFEALRGAHLRPLLLHTYGDILMKTLLADKDSNFSLNTVPSEVLNE